MLGNSGGCTRHGARGVESIHNFNQLFDINQLPVGVGCVTHQHRAAGVLILPIELTYVSILTARKPVFTCYFPRSSEVAKCRGCFQDVPPPKHIP